MSERPRKPATFKLDDPGVVVMDPDEAGRPAAAPFASRRKPTRRCCRFWSSAFRPGATRFSLGGVFWTAVGGWSCSVSGSALPG